MPSSFTRSQKISISIFLNTVKRGGTLYFLTGLQLIICFKFQTPIIKSNVTALTFLAAKPGWEICMTLNRVGTIHVFSYNSFKNCVHVLIVSFFKKILLLGVKITEDMRIDVKEITCITEADRSLFSPLIILFCFLLFSVVLTTKVPFSHKRFTTFLLTNLLL